MIYLDFDGHLVCGTAWNDGNNGGAGIVCPAYNIDGIPGETMQFPADAALTTSVGKPAHRCRRARGDRSSARSPGVLRLSLLR